MTWYGESYPLDWGTVIAGPTFYIPSLYYHYRNPTNHHVFAAGDSVIIGSYANPVDWTAFVDYASPVETRWVLEVLGGSGTFHLHAGIDPTFNYNNTALATQDLGTFSITGPTMIVTDPIPVDHAFHAANNEALILWIECTSGSVDVKQVKLRVWPTSGPSGRWRSTTTEGRVSAPGAIYMQLGGTVNTVDGVQSTVIWGEDKYVEAAGNALAAAQAGLQAKGGTVQTFTGSGSTIARSEMSYSVQAFFNSVPFANDHGYKANARVSDAPGFIKAFPLGVPAPQPAGAGYDPREVWNDASASVRVPSGDPDATGVGVFGGWTGNIKGRYAASQEVVGGTPVPLWPVGPAVIKQISTAVSTTYHVYAGGADNASADGEASSTADIVWETDIFGGEEIAVVARVPGSADGYPEPVRGAIPHPDPNTGGTPYYDWTVGSLLTIEPGSRGITYDVVFPAGSYQYFDPTLPWDDGAKPLLYVTVAPVTGDPRDASHSVGINKRAADASIFKVHPTPDGTYRELRPGESTSDVSAAYPLKVKLYDGSFVTVAYMTLDP